MRLYHATLKSNLTSITEKGIDPSFSKGAEKVIWLHTAGRRWRGLWITDQTLHRFHDFTDATEFAETPIA